ncbi:NADH-quinone oxidoreductase subunit NuoG [Methylococcus capsulatus]|uniref:NADH-quinone oxidoreductase n=1 Tax=Methylococcus capsulatus TaxID=414 RepID=A0AA35UXT2_METCP|nr:NADH-quinone oxidoreductase subunit NuoG [Methylococcus capsulatus]CAI8891400.1 NADH:quinone oxidoreductase subunit G [Methylococcus capsulatus]
MPDKIVGNDFGPPKAGPKDGLQGGSPHKIVGNGFGPPKAGLHIEIDGKSHPVKAGENLLQAILSLGLDLPYFCWHPAMGSVGACRQCGVIQFKDANDAQGRVVMACMTPVAEGMRISLQGPDAKAFRAGILELLMTNHPHDCPVCEEGGECHLQDMTVMTGHTVRQYRGLKRTHRNQDLGPFINHEMNRCIACYRCVRYYQDYCGGDDLQVFASHNHVYFGRQEDGVLENEFSGNLVEVCPTGVFTDKTFSRHYSRKWDLQTAPSVCVHCGIGCNTSPGERYGSLRRIVNRYHGEINGYFLCDRGRFGYGFVNGPARLYQARSAETGPLDVSTAENRLRAMLEDAKGIVGIGSPRASLEANFALRERVGAERFHAGIGDAEHGCLRTLLDLVRNLPLHLVSLREAERADAVLILGEDPTQTAPRLALALRQAVRNRALAIADELGIPHWQDAAVREAAQAEKSPLFIASPAPTRLDDIAARTCRASPRTIARLGFAVAHGICPEAPAVMGLTPEHEALAAEIAQALTSAERPLIVAGTGCLSEDVLRAVGQIAAALAAARPGRATAVHFAVPECNSLGLALMDAQSLAHAAHTIESGEADTLLILENDLYRRADRTTVDALLTRARQVIVIDHTLHATAERAHLVLPAASFAETEGTLVSSEGRAQRFFAAMQPAGDSRDGWRWLGPWPCLDDLTRALADSLPVFQQITACAPGAAFRIAGQKIPRQPHRYSGRTAMLADIRIHEPKQPEDTDSALAFSMEGAANDHPPALNPFVWAPGWNSNQAVGKFQDEAGGHLSGGDPGIRLIGDGAGTGLPWSVPPETEASIADALRLVPLHHIFGSDETSMHSSAVAERAPHPYVALNPEDAARLGLAEGEEVELAPDVWLPVKCLPGLAAGIAGVPAGLPDLPVPVTAWQSWKPNKPGDETS